MMATQRNNPATSRSARVAPGRDTASLGPPARTRRHSRRTALDARRLARQASQDHQDQGREQCNRQLILVAGLMAGDHRRDEDSHRQEAGDHEEQGQLHVPGPRQVVGEPLADVHSVEPGWFDVIVGVGAAEESLEEEQSGNDQKIPGRCPLGRSQAHVFRRAKSQAAAGVFFVGPVPAQQIVLADEEQHQARPAQQSDQAQYAPQERFGRRLVPHHRFRRPVIGVRVVGAGPRGAGDPRRPGKIGRKPVDVVGVGDVRPLQPALLRYAAEVLAIIVRIWPKAMLCPSL